MREPFSFIEIVQDFCTLEYGSSPCEAVLGTTGDFKCFNTKKSCQDLENFDKGDLVLRFGFSNANNDKSLNLIPSIKNISISPSILNIGGSSSDSKPLGQRSSITVSFVDHPYSDFLVDKYVNDRPYTPYERGTFWAKWKSRNPYYKNRKLIFYEGYVGDDISEMTKREYFIDVINGPDSNGNVSITAKDILKLADDKAAQAPSISTGELIDAIASSGSITTIRITNALESEYSSFDTVRIDDELFTFTGTSTISDTEINLTGVTRATDGTSEELHEIGDRVQVCLRYTNERVDSVVYDLLVNYGNIDSSYIDFTAWEDEADFWLNQFLLSAVISEPIGVTTLLGELTDQFLFYIWWSEENQKILFEAIKPATEEEVKTLSDDYSIIENSISIKDDTSNRFSQIWVFYNQKNITEKIEEEKNYKNVSIRADLAAESDTEYQEQRIKKIYSRWVSSEIQAENITARLLSRFRETQKLITFDLDAKDNDVKTASIVDIKHRNLVDFTGLEKIDRWQVISMQDIDPSHKIRVMLSLFEYGAGERFGKWTTDLIPDYSASSEAERETNGYWSDDDGLMPDNSFGYKWV